MMSKEQIERELERQQEIQMANQPSSRQWQEASKRIGELVQLLTGKPMKDAWGKR